ncbi:MAG: hypothetical protein RCG15_08660 [Candidatus Rickettsia vulgarisii]
MSKEKILELLTQTKQALNLANYQEAFNIIRDAKRELADINSSDLNKKTLAVEVCLVDVSCDLYFKNYQSYYGNLKKLKELHANDPVGLLTSLDKLLEISNKENKKAKCNNINN